MPPKMIVSNITLHMKQKKFKVWVMVVKHKINMSLTSFLESLPPPFEEHPKGVTIR
jgi:hypothetical protein